MMWLNKTIKGLGYFAIHLLTAFKCYLLSLVFTSPVVVTSLAIISSLQGSLPQTVNEKFLLVYLCVSIPLFLLFFILVETGYIMTYVKGR